MSFHKEVTSHVDCMPHSSSYHNRGEEGSETKAQLSSTTISASVICMRGFLCGCTIATELQIWVANYWLKLRVKGGIQHTTGGILLLGS